MTSPVQLYIYDQSKGLARAMSMQFLGRRIDGIWHTSVVVFNKEISYGRGISITGPGQSHHGQPVRIMDMGETAVDEQTFEEYIEEMSEHYTADKYHLLDFNCNTFTDDCIGFLTGGSVPAWIKDLPADFLSTPFGAALRPTIDAMFSPPTGSGSTQPTTSYSLPQAASNRTTNAAAAATARALASDSGYSSNSTPTPTPSNPNPNPIHVSTDPASFRRLLGAHRAVVAMFTSATCGPCRMIEPVFEELARAKKAGGKERGDGVAFVKVDLGVGMGVMVAREHNVAATPTFGFFLDGKRIHELRGVNAPELRTQVDLLLYQAFPPHPHTSLDLPAISSLSTEPILFTQVPALDTVHDKLVSFIDSAPSLPNPSKIKDDLAQSVFPWLKQRYVQKSKAAPNYAVADAFRQTTTALVAHLPAASIFPLLDIWRLAILEPAIAQASLAPLIQVLTSTNESLSSSPRATLLTLLRLSTNALGSSSLSRSLLAGGGDVRARAALTGVLINTLLHPDRLVRVAAASLAFNVGAWVQRGRIGRVRGGDVVDGIRDGEEDGEWEVELVSAVAEALASEEESEDAVHRLTATLAFLIRLSPSYQEQLAPLLNVLGVRETLKGKLAEGAELKVRKKEVRVLLEEVADQLCKP
ncbi:PPPDE putative peptidase domain-containing protein [Lactifluus subvellereus]|nr:PPPDE putative peptidase domain-containing protein [Lactifluus subvellereus]